MTTGASGLRMAVGSTGPHDWYCEVLPQRATHANGNVRELASGQFAIRSPRRVTQSSTNHSLHERIEMSHHSRLWLLGLVLLGGCLVHQQASAQVTLSQVRPQAVAPGKTIDVTLTGAKLDEPLSVWTSFPAKVEIVPLAEPKPGQTTRVCKITVEAGVPVGIGGISVATAEGVSDVALMLVDDAPSVAENGQNVSAAAAQELALPTAVDGVSDGARSDFYKFSAQAGQRVALEVFAARLGQTYDPVVRLFDPSGKEVALADDDAALGPDARLAYICPAAGSYVVEIRDNQYRGGGNYRLRVGDFPLVTTAFPLGVQVGTPAKVGFVTAGGEQLPPVDVSLPSDVAGRRVPLGAKLASGATSGLATLLASAAPQATEIEPNNELAQATPLAAPGGANGRLDAPGDRDHYKFEAKKGQRLAFRATSRSVNSPTLVKMYILKADGAALAESPVSDADEETLVYAVPEDGVYLLAVEDLLRRGGPEFVYHVAVEPVAPFRIVMKPDKAQRARFVVAKNGALAIDVTVARNGYDGPIQLSVEGPGGAYQSLNGLIPDKGAAGKVLVVPPAGVNPGQFLPLKVVGKATIDGKEVVSSVAMSDWVRVQRPVLSYPPSWFDGWVAASVSADQTPFYVAALDRATAVLPKGGTGQGEFVVKFDRKNDQFKDPLQVYILNGPPGLSFEVKRNGNGPAETYQVIVKGAAALNVGRYPVQVIGYAEHGGKGQLVPLPELPLEVAAPLNVSVAPAGLLVFGNTQKVRIAAGRLAVGGQPDRQPIVVKWKKLPPGVTGPTEVTIPADKDFVDVDLTAAADAPAGAIPDLQVTATTKFQGQDVTAESPPLATEVKK